MENRSTLCNIGINKAVLELRVSPAFTITYFCNHCNIRFENTSMWMVSFFQKTWTKGHWPQDDLCPQVCWGHMCDSTKGSLCPSPTKIHQSMWIQWPFFQTLEPKVIDPRWPLTPCLLRSHVWLYLRIIVSKSHGNTSMYVDTVINFAKLPQTTYPGGVLTLTWYTYMCLPFGVLFREIWYSDGGGVSSGTKEPKLHKLGVFWANCCKKHPIWSKLGAFLSKMVYWWVGNLTKNWYRDSQIFEVRQAHPRTTLVKEPPRATYIHRPTTYGMSDHIVSYWTQLRRDKNGLRFEYNYRLITTYLLCEWIVTK